MKTLKVVIVDDEQATWGVINKLADWEKYNMKVIAEFSNGKEVLEFTEINQIDILITDMNMPSMDGVQLLKILADEFSEMKTIVVSGYDHFEYLQHAIRAQTIDYLLKPIDALELNKALEKAAIAIGKKRHQNPLAITQSSQALVPILQDFNWKLSAFIKDRDEKQLQSIFQQLKNDVNHLIKEADTVYAKLHYELITSLEEQLYQYDLSLQDLELTELELYLDPERNINDMLEKMETTFYKLLQYLLDFK